MRYEVKDNGEVFVFVTQKELDVFKNQILCEMKVVVGNMKHPDNLYEKLKFYYNLSNTARQLENGENVFSLASNKSIDNYTLFYFMEKHWKDAVKEVRKYWKGHIGVKCKLDALQKDGE